MVNKNNIAALKNYNKKQFRDILTPNNPCLTAVPGTQEQVFCQVQKFPRIVVLPKGFGYLETLQLNQCVEVGPTNAPCGFNCCTQFPFSTDNTPIEQNNQEPYNPNPPFPFVPPEEQIRRYNIASRLNQCDVNKNNFFPNSGRPESARVGPFGAI